MMEQIDDKNCRGFVKRTGTDVWHMTRYQQGDYRLEIYRDKDCVTLDFDCLEDLNFFLKEVECAKTTLHESADGVDDPTPKTMVRK